MKKRDIVAVVVVVALLAFFIYFVVLGGSNPFVPKLNVRVTAGVRCVALWPLKVCWFNREVTVEHKPKLSILAWICGLGQKMVPIEVTLEVTNPDFSSYSEMQSKKTCEAGDVEFFFTIPLNKGVGTYRYTVTVCGETEYIGWQCVDKTGSYMHGG